MFLYFINGIVIAHLSFPLFFGQAIVFRKLVDINNNPNIFLIFFLNSIHHWAGGNASVIEAFSFSWPFTTLTSCLTSQAFIVCKICRIAMLTL